MDGQIGLFYAKGSDTSKAAAKRMAAKPMKIRADHQRILNVLLSGPKTDREAIEILRNTTRPDMTGSTYRPRRGELVEMGRVVDTGERRDRATLWGLA